ncbi:MAG: hypothetical protein ACYTEQ_25720 [Planctomycetota bacterium]|jgi:hypothetical protein
MPHEKTLVEMVRRMLAHEPCGVGIPINPDDAVEREDAFATAIFDAISDESHHADLNTSARHLTQRLQWMSAVLDYIRKNLESEIAHRQEFDANEVTDSGGGGVTSASKT